MYFCFVHTATVSLETVDNMSCKQCTIAYCVNKVQRIINAINNYRFQIIIIKVITISFSPCTVKKSGKANSIPGGIVLYFFWSGDESIYMDRAFLCDFLAMMTP